MSKRISGSLLIETIIATAIVIFLVVLVYVSFAEVTRWGTRNRQSGIALTLLGTYIDRDATLSYTDTSLTPGTLQATKDATGYATLDQLPEAVLTRVITESRTVKKVQYILEWQLNGRTQRTTAEHEIIQQGLTNE